MAAQVGTRVGDWVVESTLGVDLLGPYLQVHHVDEPAYRATLHLLDDVDHVGFRRLRETVVRSRGLTHPAVARVRRVGRSGRHVFLEFERLDGALLGDREIQGTERREVVEEVAEAISWLHQQGLSHGALRSSTVLLRSEGRPVLLSAGIGTRLPDIPLVELQRQDLLELGRLILPGGSGAAAYLDEPSRLQSERAHEVTEDVARETREGLTRIGPYVILEEVGRGGMGVVYRAREPGRRHDVAVKVLISGDGATRGVRERFAREVATMATIRHPAIVRILDSGTHDGVPYYVMELLHGSSLRQELMRVGAFSVSEAVTIVRTVARGLHAAHLAGVVHRDVKPENILLSKSGGPVLTDFGLARHLEEDGARLTMTGQRLGTIGYMAPEQLLGEARRVGPATDVYALGKVLLELCHGAPRAHASLTRRALPAALQDIQRCATAQRVEDRYPSAGAFADDLERFQSGRRPLASGWRASVLAGMGTWQVSRAVLLGGMAFSASWLLWSMHGSWRDSQQLMAQEARATLRFQRMVDVTSRSLEDGQRAAAVAHFDKFVDAEELRGTRAASRAWLHRSKSPTAWGDTDPVHALSRAYLSARRSEERRMALSSMASVYLERWDYEGLERVTQMLPARDPLRRVLSSFDVPLGRRSYARAADGAESAVAAQWLTRAARASKLPFHGTRLLEIPGVRRAHGWLLVDANEQTISLVRAEEGELRVHESLAWPESLGGLEVVFCAGVTHAGETILATWTAESRTARLVGVFQGQITSLAEWSDDRVATATMGDVDDDGVAEIYVGIGAYARTLRRFTQKGTRWIEGAEVLSLGQGRSDVGAVVVADLEQDGEQDLFVASGAWHAYDLRWLVPVRDGWETRARQRMGVVSRAEVVHRHGESRLAVLKVDRYPSPELFGADQPYGDAQGVYELGADRDGLVERWFAALPHTSTDVMVSGDFTGNGQTDYAVGVRPRDAEHDAVYMILRSDDGEHVGVPMLDLELMGAGDLDGDGLEELIVRDLHGDRALWVLGRGTGSLPQRAGHSRGLEDMTWEDPELRHAWQTASDLQVFGTPALAASVLRDGAALSSSTDEAGRMLMQAGAWLSSSGERVEAAHVLHEAAEQSGLAEAWLQAAEAYEQVYRYEQAGRVVLKGIASSSGSAAGTLQLLAARDRIAGVMDEPRQTYRFDRPLDLGWRIRSWQPVEAGVRASSLRLEPSMRSSDVRLLSRPVQWVSSRLSLTVDMTIERLEWSAGLNVELVDPEGRRVGLGVMSGGGAGLFNLEAGCTWPGQRPEPARQLLERIEGPHHVRLRFDLRHGDPVVRCEASIDGETTQVGHIELPEPPRRDGPLELVIVGKRWAPGDGVVHGAFRLHSLEMAGAEELDHDVVDDRLRRLKATGEMLELLASLDPHDASEQVVRASVLMKLERNMEAARATRRAWPRGESPPALMVQYLRSDPERWSAHLREVVTPRELVMIVWLAWQDTLSSHRDVLDRQTASVLLHQLPGLAEVEPGGDEELARAIIGLLRAKSLVNSQRAELQTARSDLVRASVLLDQFPTVRRAALVTGGIEQLYLELAVLELAIGDQTACLYWLDRALQSAPDRFIVWDMIRIHPRLTSLHAHPGWLALASQVRSL